MKNLYIIGGTMGIGKTTVCQRMKIKLKNSVFLDGDWCWDADPFTVNKETKNMVIKNICFLLNSFINCSEYDNIIFCWVMHEQSIINSIVSNIDCMKCNIKIISLICSSDTLRKRLKYDIAKGIRTEDVISRSIDRLPLYAELDTLKINTDDMSIDSIADAIINMKSDSQENLKKAIKMYNCGFTIANKWFRYRAAAIIIENGCVLFAGNELEDYYYSVGGAVHIGETAEDAVVREVFEETGIRYEIDHLAVIHENFFTESNGTLKGLECHEICFYFIMKPRNTTALNSNSYTFGVKEEMHWIPIEDLDKYKAFPSFLKEYLNNNHKGIEHIVTFEEDK